MKVLFLYPLWTGDYEGISGYFAKKSGGTYIPYNLALLAAITEKSGHEAKIIDGELEKISLNEIVERSKEYNPDIILSTQSFLLAIPTIRHIKYYIYSINFSCF